MSLPSPLCQEGKTSTPPETATHFPQPSRGPHKPVTVSESESVLTSVTAFPHDEAQFRLKSVPEGSLLGQRQKTATPAKGRGLCSLSVIREICHLGRGKCIYWDLFLIDILIFNFL